MNVVFPFIKGHVFGKCLQVSFPVFLCLVVTIRGFPSCAPSARVPVFFPQKKPPLQADTVAILGILDSFSSALGNDITEAGKYASQALAMSDALGYQRGRIRSLLALADVARIRGEFPPASSYIRQASVISESGRDEVALAWCHLAQYRLLFAQGAYDEAAKINEKCLAIGERYQDPEILAESYGHKGVVQGMQGNHMTGITWFLKALDIYRAANNKAGESFILLRMGHTFELAGSYDKALEYLHRALDISKGINHLSNAGWCLLNIGVCHSRLEVENYGQKISYYKQALDLAQPSGDFRLTLACLDNIGGAYSMMGDFDKANDYLLRAYRLSARAGRNSRTVYITGNLAENFLYKGQLDSALLFGRENLRLAIEERNTFEKEQAYSVLSQIHAARNEYAEAYEMLRHHVAVSDSIFNADKSGQIEELREKYETSRKEQEIRLLTTANEAEAFRRNAFAGLAILFLVVGFLVFVILKLRIRRSSLLLQQEIELDKMKSRFFANISHEFRTPLTLIMGPIDEMIEHAYDDGIRKYLKPMRKNASRLLDLVNQLLELSKIESGNLKPRLARCNFVPIVKGVVMSFESLAATRGIKLLVMTGLLPGEMYVDQDKIEKILVNLLANAFKFTPEAGSITVDVAVTRNCRISGLTECLQVRITDSGQGIPEGEMNHVFDRFYQAANNRLSQQDGTGIGLALTKELVDMHGGTIWASAGERGGTAICFQLPLNLHETMQDCIALDEAAASTATVPFTGVSEEEEEEVETIPDNGQRASKPMVLLIEDNPDVRRYIRQTLEASYQVIESADGEAGVMIALEKIPDLILCDFMMPKMDGQQVCLFLKNEEKTSHIPIILLTAKADDQSRIEGLEAKADDYLTKPFVARELLLRIRNLIESRRNLRNTYQRNVTLKPADVAVNSVDQKFLERMMQVLENRIADEKFGVEALGAEIGMSRSQLHRKLKALIGQGPNQFIRSFRLNRAHDLLKGHSATASEIAYKVGFNSPSYFTKCFHDQFGYTPTEIPG